MNCNCYYWTLRFHQCKALAGKPVEQADERTSNSNPQTANIQHETYEGELDQADFEHEMEDRENA
jgi:hypothetical protein